MQQTSTPNRLIHEASPYLQQHAHNPVDWYPWGPEALQKAKAENKPIFLSIGYSACHWCHVMAHESFEDPAIAAVMNEHFINIKVDREERPDLDQIYQSICQMVTRGGGWPLSVWLTPEQKPFYVGTYYPPTERYGRSGFKQVLLALAQAYREQPDKIASVAGQWTEAIARSDEAPSAESGVLSIDTIAVAARGLAANVDPVNGGFGGAPKFPSPFSLEVMLRDWKHSREDRLLDLVTLTLRKMAEGGVYDQLGGGFHRYSVDATWSVPHFEKMLYDNATLPPVYLAAWQATDDPLFRRITEETLDYVIRDMTGPEGGFYSTTDADSEGQEGKYFVWGRSDVSEATGPELSAMMCRYYGVTEKGNFEHTGKTVLHIALPPERLAEERESSPEVLLPALAEGRRLMLAYREKRVPPFRDEKILTAWNGLMISSLARAGRVLRIPRYVAAARAAAGFVQSRLTNSDGGLLRRYKDGKADIAGYLEDYAYFAAALLDLYEATFDEDCLQAAIRYARETVRLFYDGNGSFYLSQTGGEPLIHRPKDATDASTPAGSSVAVMNLLRLLPYTGDDRFRTIAEAAFQAYRPYLERMPGAMGTLLHALDFYLSSATEVTLVGQIPEEWLTALGRLYLPNLVLTRIDGPREDAPIWAGKSAPNGQPTGYVCRNFACSSPAATWAQLREYLE